MSDKQPDVLERPKCRFCGAVAKQIVARIADRRSIPVCPSCGSECYRNADVYDVRIPMQRL